MNRGTESRLLEFCAEQQREFNADDWVRYDHPIADELVAVCLLLSGVEWYGHKTDFIGVAEQLHPGCSGRLSEFVSRCNFDCARFSNMLRRELRDALTTP